ncbi:MAG: lipopolysaccharide kinase InaA family protein, partial [Planctomycetota bacterium]|nr:lipopolysaccharide kinase InaA family protein [Planctomycetota bacterium]
MRWCATGHEGALEALIARLGATAWPQAPEGFEHVTPPRPMRVVLRGPLEGSRGHARVIVKWSRPDTLADHVSRHVRGGKGVREGQVLRALKAAGVRVPEVLAYADEGEDVVVTHFVDGLMPLPPADEAPAGLLEDVAVLLALAHAAGLRHADLHAGNLALSGELPLLVDLGSARMGKPISDGERARVLAALAHGLLDGARRTQCLRALIAYMRQVHGGDGRTEARALARDVESELRLVRRRFRRGRDRRATRTGKHFELIATGSGLTGIRNRDTTDASWLDRAASWLETQAEDAQPLKADGRIQRLGPLVLKYYDGVAPGRLPRPVRAFRMAYALRNRGIPAPVPHLAVTDEHGAGVLASAYIDASNLHDLIATGRYAALPAAERRSLLEHIGRTLRLMHDAEVTHRDLKAPNLL